MAARPRYCPRLWWQTGDWPAVAVTAKIELWPKEGGGEPVVLSHGSQVGSLAAIPDGRLASGGWDGTIKLRLADEQKLIAALCLRAGRNLTKVEWAHYVGSDIPWQPLPRPPLELADAVGGQGACVFPAAGIGWLPVSRFLAIACS
jgi:hypothetical protein